MRAIDPADIDLTAFTGNVHDKVRQSGYCHSCGQRLIGRNRYALSDRALSDEGACTKCGTRCAGVFDAPPATEDASASPCV